MEIQDYTSLVTALETVDELLVRDVKKSVLIAEDKKQDVFNQMCTYLSETLTPLLQHPAFQHIEFYDRGGIKISTGRFNLNGVVGCVVQLYHGSLGTGVAAKCYFAQKSSTIIVGDFNAYKIAEMAGMWKIIKQQIKDVVALTTKNYASDIKSKSEKEARIAESLVNFQV